MTRKSKFLVIGISLILMLSFAGCVSSSKVTFATDVEGAEVYVDGELIGNTPVTITLSNAVWKNPSITFKKDGYVTMDTYLQKEVKPANIVFGLCLNWPAFLWCYGPCEKQNFILPPEQKK